MPLTLSDDAAKHAAASIKRFFAEELDQDIGELKAALVLDFILAEIAPSVYNGAITDAAAYFRERVADLDGACTMPEFAFWEKPGVKRARSR